MDLKQLITFATIAKEKNYIKASEKLNYAPSTLAKHIRSLESEFNTSLVEYTNNKIELTYEGKRFLRYADEMLSIYNKMQNTFNADKNNDVIRVGGGELMVSFSFGKLFADYNRKTSVSVQVNTVCCSKVPGWLQNNEVDLGFVQTLDTSVEDDIDIIPLFKEKLCLMTSKNHHLANVKDIHFKDLEDSRFAFTYEECCFTEEFRRRLEMMDININEEYFLGSIHAVMNSVKEDDCICLIPYVCVKQIEQFDLVKLDFADEFDIYNVILLKQGYYDNSEINSIITASKDYVKYLKEDKNTEDIIIL